jgi:hypothetical protein
MYKTVIRRSYIERKTQNKQYISLIINNIA